MTNITDPSDEHDTSDELVAGTRVFITGEINELGVEPARIGTVTADCSDVVYITLDPAVDDVPGVGRIVQWTDPADADVEVDRDRVREIKG